jgi:hypothetical protein
VRELLAHPGYDGGWRERDLRALLDPLVVDQPDHRRFVYLL